MDVQRSYGIQRARPDRSEDRFHDDPTKSFTLAASYYFDDDVFAAERTAIFQNSWQYIGHSSTVASAGQYVCAEVGGQRVFALRSASGELKAYFNVCLHRGHSLLEGEGTVSSMITCPYHAWVYDTEGCLTGARMSDRMEDFDFDDYQLSDVAVEDFCGFIFVNLSTDPQPMDTVYPGAREAILGLCGDPGSLALASVSTFDIAANWKNVGDNLLECYHCHPAHKGFVDLIDMSGYVNEVHENWSVQSGPAASESGQYEVTSGAPGFASLFLWPNLSFGQLPGQRGLSMFKFEPTEPERTLQTFSYFYPGAETEAERGARNFFDNVLGPEDVALVEDVQVGLRSLGYHQGRFICIPDRPEISEHAVHHFHSMVLAALNT